MKKDHPNTLLKNIQKHVLNQLKQAEQPARRYHKAEHTKLVAGYADLLARHYQLNETDYDIVMAATWFHDTGYLKGSENPEQESALFAESFLIKSSLDTTVVESIKGCILATSIPQSPVNLNEHIVCDAQLYYLGTDHFFKEIKLLRKEWMLLNKRRITKSEWAKFIAALMEQHAYHTDFCQSKLNVIKIQNRCDLIQEFNKDGMGFRTVDSKPPLLKPTTGEKQPKNGKANDKPEKGIETMFRISSGNHQRLSDMADKKAHIMITVNSIILSAVISLVLRKLDTYGFLVIPTFILLIISLAAMTFSILATRPSVPHGTFEQADLDNKQVNLLFFGNFYKMHLDQFAAGMEMMMEDGPFLYASLIRDVYAQGVVLGKKYHLLRISYNIFMYGAIAAVGAFMLAYLFNQNAALVVPATVTHH